MNVVRDLAASAVVPDVGFLVIGGKDGEGNSMDTTEGFRDNRDGWIYGPVTPGSIYHHCATIFQDMVVLVTGGIGQKNEFLNQTFVINMVTDQITILPSMLWARAQHGCAATEQGYVVAGGYSGDVHIYYYS